MRRLDVLAPAQLVAAALTATLAWTSSHVCIGAAFLALGFAGGLNYNRALYVSLRHPARRGLKSGMHEAVLVIGILIGSLGGGLMVKLWGLRAPYAPMGALTVVFVAAQIVLVRRERKRRAAS